jgi:hypothetical protein
MRSLAVLAAILATADARGLETGAGATATAGSGGYRRLALFADATETGGRVEPYGWGEAAFSRELRQFSLGGGAWDNWTDAERGKAGLGFAGGRYDDGQGAASVIAELGAEKDAGPSTLGAGWRLTYGTLASSRDAPSLESAANARARGRRARAQEAESFAVNELSAYGRLREDFGVLGLRFDLDFPPYGPAIESETASVRLPVGKRFWLTPAVTLEQGSADAVYLSLTAYCRL